MSAFKDLPQPFARADVLAADLSPRAIGREVARGLVIEVAKRLYAVRSPWEEQPPWVRHRSMAAAAVRLTKDAIISHASDAALLGLPYPTHPPSRVSMTLMDDGRTLRSDSWRRFARAQTPYEHVEIRDGVPRLVRARTVIDCARVLHPRDALAIADGALRAGMVTHEALLTMRRHQRKWPGVAKANDVLMLADGRRENWLESASAWAAHEWGLPIAVPQVNILTSTRRFAGRCDALWPDEGIVGEADGVEKYLMGGSSEAAVLQRLEAEAVRQRGFTELGLEVVRWVPREAIDGAELHARFQAAKRGAGSPTLTAEFACSCCSRALAECSVEAHLRQWRRQLVEEFAPKVW
ncbi:hypothetical protein N802_04930 [Knoellia sinensis KCTC 19936]|uniref:AbiEi antitoxin C-terminal domain-containing protein n=1 Tax=Knoellia sinensis KCTC 19936 TaxID=1385520 RepID=A0A0A0J1B5_9MICO|nr:hypothetical protein [Knoellia sinensis]KGN31205.1 hypothetical protein N802_04930 [Knoellia sinensis KCTC 19936]